MRIRDRLRNKRTAGGSEFMQRTIYLAGGCFWGVEKYIDQFDGVLATTVGYANGRTENPSYEQVCRENTGHAETVKVQYDDGRISTGQLLEYYFLVIDPLSVNRQGNDVGTQYRTGIFFDDDELLPEIMKMVQKERRKVGQPLAVEVRELENFYPAEEYHQKYLNKNPGGYCHIRPEMMRIKKDKRL